MTVIPDFYIKQGDLLPYIEVILKNADGTIVNLTGATVMFRMAKRGSTPKVNAAATIVGSASDGRVQYQWTSADTDTIGEFRAEWVVTFGNGKTQTHPNDTWHTIRILEKA